MKILNVGNYNIKKNGLIFYDTCRKLNNGFIRLGHSVYGFSDRDMARAGTLFHARKLGVGYANRRLLECCHNYQPHAIFLGHADVIRAETLLEIRKILPSVRIAQWNVDPLFEPDNVARLNTKVDVVDATFITTAGTALGQFARPNRITAFMPNPVDGAMETACSFARDDQPVDMLYCVGSPKTPRQYDDSKFDITHFAEDLMRCLPQVHFRFHGILGQPNIYGTAYEQAHYDATMGLSLSRRSDNYLYASDRMAHMTGNGLLTFVDRATGFTDLYAENELAFYSSFDELVDRIATFKAHDNERRAVAEAGWLRSHALFDSTRIAKYLLEQLFATPLSEEYEWPTAVL